MKGLLSWVCAPPAPPTPESVALEKIMDAMWAELSSGIDANLPFTVLTSNTRRRRVWRGRRFSYVTNWRLALKQVDPYLR